MPDANPTVFAGSTNLPPGEAVAEKGSFGYFEHGADIGVIGRGPTLEEAFEQAAAAMFRIMADRTGLPITTDVSVSFEETDTEIALVQWLNALLAEAQIEHLIPVEFHIERNGAAWHGVARGERWSAAMKRGVEVKGATLTMLSVRHDERGWEARCVVDV